MRALIGHDLVRKLERKNVESRDTKLTSFTIRCRATGTHVYRLTLGRGDTRTIGRVGTMTPEAARLSAEALIASVSRDALKRTVATAQRSSSARTRRCGTEPFDDTAAGEIWHSWSLQLDAAFMLGYLVTRRG